MSRMEHDPVSGSMNVCWATGRKTHHLKKGSREENIHTGRAAEQQMADRLWKRPWKDVYVRALYPCSSWVNGQA